MFKLFLKCLKFKAMRKSVPSLPLALFPSMQEEPPLFPSVEDVLFFTQSAALLIPFLAGIICDHAV